MCQLTCNHLAAAHPAPMPRQAGRLDWGPSWILIALPASAAHRQMWNQMGLDLPLGQRGLDEEPGLTAEAVAERHLGTQLEEPYLRDPLSRRESLLGIPLGTLSLCKLLTGPSLPVLGQPGKCEARDNQGPERCCTCSWLPEAGHCALCWPGFWNPGKALAVNLKHSVATRQGGRPFSPQEVRKALSEEERRGGTALADHIEPTGSWEGVSCEGKRVGVSMATKCPAGDGCPARCGLFLCIEAVGPQTES